MTPAELAARIAERPRVRFCRLPTPLHSLERLSERLGGPEIWIKRDDLTGFGMSGNKGRKLEFLMADAMARGATHILTVGAQQSNHARQTAAAAAALGLPCRLVLTGGPPTHTGNQTLFDWLGAEATYLGDVSWGELRRTSERMRDGMAADGEKPYLIPVGGSTPLGALGFVLAAVELLRQGGEFDALYHASSSGSTQAGLVAGLALCGARTEVRGVMVDDSRAPEPYLAELANGITDLLGIERRFDASAFRCDLRHLGPGYAKPSEDGVEAIRLLARTEGIFVEPVYTGKALAGLIAAVERGEIGKGDRVLFWHTGGVPVLFAEQYVPLARGLS